MTNNQSAKRGRPKLPDEHKRDELAQFRCTSEEKLSFEQAAKKAEKSLSDWLRDQAVKAS